LVIGLGKGQTGARSSLASYAANSSRIRTLLDELINDAISKLGSSSRKNPSISSIEMLAHANYSNVKDKLMALLSSEESPNVQLAALRVLSGFGENGTGKILVQAFPGMSPAMRAEVVEILLSRSAWSEDLLGAVETGKIGRGEIPPLRQNQLVQHADKVLRTRASRLLGGESNPRSAVIESYQASLSMPGDPGRGLQVFEKNCTACHRHGHVGTRVGPDMGTIQNRTPESLLIQILDPNREVLGSYLQYLVVLNDGSIASGRIISESPASITLQRAVGVEETFLRQNIRSIQGSGMSLMPEGLEVSINHQAMSDLISFLLAQ
ncbi:MAG: c-type cytochrome, partial [Verrucomicrobiae bacterium]|nr:c-type cytochrome [Verrucomicrobiae bacterium]